MSRSREPRRSAEGLLLDGSAPHQLAKLLDDLVVGDCFSSGEFALGQVDIPENLDLFNQRLVLCNPHENSGALAVLRQDERTPRFSDLFNE